MNKDQARNSPEQDSLRIAIVGAGAIGSSLGYFLKIGGADPWLIDPWKDHVNAIDGNGLTVNVENQDRQVPFRATTDPSVPGTMDVVIMLTKSNYLQDSIRNAKPLIGPQTKVIGLQNGLGHVDILSEFVPKEQILYGLCEIGGDLLGPGHVRPAKGLGRIPFKPVDGVIDETVRALVEILAAGGIDFHHSPDIEQSIWTKLCTNASFNATCALTRLNSSALLGHPEAAGLIKSIVDEVCAVAEAKGITVDRDHVEQFAAMGSKVDHHPSMAQDAMRKRPTEIEFLNGAVAREGAKLGIPTPVNETIARLVRILESTYDQQF